MTEKEYKEFIDSAEKNTDRRISQNSLYTTLNLAFLSYITASSISGLFVLLSSVVGCSLSIIWFLVLNNYSKRNAIKFELINEYEKSNNIKAFSKEYEMIKKKKLPNLSFFEKLLPIMFFLIYLTIGIMGFIK